MSCNSIKPSPSSSAATSHPEADPNLAAVPHPLWLLPHGIISTHYGPCIADQSSGRRCGLSAVADSTWIHRLPSPVCVCSSCIHGGLKIDQWCTDYSGWRWFCGEGVARAGDGCSLLDLDLPLDDLLLLKKRKGNGLILPPGAETCCWCAGRRTWRRLKKL